jgi:hypothetical protein
VIEFDVIEQRPTSAPSCSWQGCRNTAPGRRTAVAWPISIVRIRRMYAHRMVLQLRRRQLVTSSRTDSCVCPAVSRLLARCRWPKRQVSDSMDRLDTRWRTLAEAASRVLCKCRVTGSAPGGARLSSYSGGEFNMCRSDCINDDQREYSASPAARSGGQSARSEESFHCRSSRLEVAFMRQ